MKPVWRKFYLRATILFTLFMVVNICLVILSKRFWGLLCLPLAYGLARIQPRELQLHALNRSIDRLRALLPTSILLYGGMFCMLICALPVLQAFHTETSLFNALMHPRISEYQYLIAATQHWLDVFFYIMAYGLLYSQTFKRQSV